MQAKVEKSSVQSRLKPKFNPAEAAVVTVPGPINAAEMTDQKSIWSKRFMV
jgi:hypothetical protein